MLPQLEFSQHRMSVRKRKKAEKPIAVRQSNWSAMTHYLLSVSNSWEQNFLNVKKSAFVNVKEVCITQNKKNFTNVF